MGGGEEGFWKRVAVLRILLLNVVCSLCTDVVMAGVVSQCVVFAYLAVATMND